MSFKVHDILNQTRNLTHTVTANYEEDAYRLMIAFWREVKPQQDDYRRQCKDAPGGAWEGPAWWKEKKKYYFSSL